MLPYLECSPLMRIFGEKIWSWRVWLMHNSVECSHLLEIFGKKIWLWCGRIMHNTWAFISWSPFGVIRIVIDFSTFGSVPVLDHEMNCIHSWWFSLVADLCWQDLAMAIKPTVVLRAAAAAGLAAAAKMATVFKAAGGLKMGAAGAAMAAAAVAATGSRKKVDNQQWRQLEIPTPILGHGHQLVVQTKVFERTMWVVLVGEFCSNFCLSDGYWCSHIFCNSWFSLDPSEVAKHEDGFLRTQVFVGFVLESGVL